MNPYTNAQPNSFWRSGVKESSPFDLDAIYNKKFDILPHWKIATAGSCFAQHIARHLKNNGYSILNEEPGLRSSGQILNDTFGYGVYSARYGNIYTVRQLLQLTKEALGEFKPLPNQYVWERNGRYFDAFRPSVEPDGLTTPDEVVSHRKRHLLMVRRVLEKADLLIFTMGLTEAWQSIDKSVTYPIAPGVLAGSYNPEAYSPVNFSFYNCINDFNDFQKRLLEFRGKKGLPRILLTVSPVPLTATSTDNHILAASTYSKAVLRSVSGYLAEKQSHIGYFPSYEIINNPSIHSGFFCDNLREVRPEAVNVVMQTFSKSHNLKNTSVAASNTHNKSNRDIQCEEALLENFN